jgi:hypothetical protein
MLAEHTKRHYHNANKKCIKMDSVNTVKLQIIIYIKYLLLLLINVYSFPILHQMQNSVLAKQKRVPFH